MLDFHPKAQVELQEATAYYDRINRKFGDSFVNAVERTLNRIAQYPDAWTPMIQSTRRCRVNGFPYGIVYRFVGDRIQVIAVMHLQRKPNYWQKRL